MVNPLNNKKLTIFLIISLFVVGCAANNSEGPPSGEAAQFEAEMLPLPELTPVTQNGEKLRVVATTSIIGDVVAQVGGDAIELTTLMDPGQDPHGFNPTAQELTAVANAHVILVNGWRLEEGLIATLQNVAGDTPMIPISARIQPQTIVEMGAAGDELSTGVVDPHTWLDPQNVIQWTENLNDVFSQLDPANTAVYQANTTAYQVELTGLIAYFKERVSRIPADDRKLVANHDALGYFARAYGFEVIGTVIPAVSTQVDPSASGLADLVQTMTDAGVCAIFTETTVNDNLAQAAAAELTSCESVQIVPLYTGAVGPVGSGADTYISMMQANIEAITAVYP